MAFNIVLVEPEIPQNTGNIARTCASTGTKLHIVKPMGFEIDDRKLKRAGLDYWHLLGVQYYENLEEFLRIHGEKRLFLASTKAPRRHSDVSYRDGDFLVFGKETKGLPEDFIKARLDMAVRIPMLKEARSLNLSNSVAIMVYEALRQTNYENLQTEGMFATK
ncbi:MAG: tRNA (uridine(34)/cytosine(34)/5-carboxymethylaminomethyluridine(34)-2'-O)-methyltransferase TrmL [Ruminococcaceae bacterium]|nr:tRNA (uridine(34)/cytosine(34)/5-carboxymethylaminomethyluridine(34)-2'-O)-methyltransferase TrmL [Oscillospiraceae bacterium]